MSSTDDAPRLSALLSRTLDAHAVVLYEAVAERLGLNATDLLGVQLIAAEGETTPGRLAELAGITTGAITGVLDRLEKARIVVREADPDDRRRVVVRLSPARLGELIAVLEPMAISADALLIGYKPVERAAITDYLGKAAAAAVESTARLRATTRGGFVNDTYSAPLGGATRGRLVFVTGGPRLSMNVAPFGPGASARIIMETAASRLAFERATDPGQLISAAFTGPLPDCRVADGVVTIRYRRSPFSSRRARVRLNPSIPWTVEVSGGITDLTGDIGAPLATLEVSGGANHIKLDLPAPTGTAAVRVTGVVSGAALTRPSSVPVHLLVGGGISHLRLDDVTARQVSGRRHYESGDYAGTPDRYDIEITGGAADVRIVPR
jgi:DNA-binding MarR family transcriptional regulator